MMHPIKGYGPSLGDQGVDPDDPIHTEQVANCPGCEVEWDDRAAPGGLPAIRYCADHDPEELRGLLDDAEADVAALRRALAFIANEADPSQTLAPHVGGDLATIARVARAVLSGESLEEPRRREEG
jgi:hypothetical protein